MQRSRRFLALLLSAVMCLSLCIPTLAVDAGTVSVTSDSATLTQSAEAQTVTLTFTHSNSSLAYPIIEGVLVLPKGFSVESEDDIVLNYTKKNGTDDTVNPSMNTLADGSQKFLFTAVNSGTFKSLVVKYTVAPNTLVGGEVGIENLLMAVSGNAVNSNDKVTTTIKIEAAEDEPKAEVVAATEIEDPVIKTNDITSDELDSTTLNQAKAEAGSMTDAIKSDADVVAEEASDLVKAAEIDVTPTDAQVDQLKQAITNKGIQLTATDKLETVSKPVFKFDYSGFEVKKDGNGYAFTKFTVSVTATIKSFLTYTSQLNGTTLKDNGVKVDLEDKTPEYKNVALTLKIPVPASFKGDGNGNVWARHESGAIFAGTLSSNVATFDGYTAGFSDIDVLDYNPTIATVGSAKFDTVLGAIKVAMDNDGTVEYKGNAAYTVDMSAETIQVGKSFKINRNGYDFTYTMPKSGNYGVEAVSTSGNVETMVFVQYPAVKVKLSPPVTGATVKIGTNVAYEIGEGVYVLTGVKTGSSQTVTASKTGYKDGTATVTAESGKLVEVTVTMTKNQSSGTVTPTKPSNNSTRYVSGGGGSGTAGVRTDIEIKPGATPSTPSGTVSNVGNFTDVKSNDWFAAPVLWAVNKGITNGVGDNRFDPNGSCTRGQMVTFLWRAAGSPDAAANGRFKDVDGNAYYAKAVAWAVANGVTDGKGATDTFAPNDQVTRAEAVTFLSRAMKGSGSGSSNFNDVPGSSWFAASVGWAVSNGITNGMGDNQFQPNGLCTRAQTVTFLYRAYGNK